MTALRKLKHIADIRVSNVDKKSAETEVPVRLCNYVDVYYNERITGDLEFMEATATRDQVNRFSLRGGDVLVTKDSETPEDIAIPAFVPADLPGIVCGYHLAIVRPRHQAIDGRYMHWALASKEVRQQSTIAATGITRFGLRQDSLGAVAIPVPTLPGQIAIAAFLDRETAWIAALIANQRRLVRLLNERIDALIKNQVGLSDIVRGGSVRTVPLKRLLRKVVRPFEPGSPVVTAYRDGEVNARANRRAEGYTLASDESTYQGVKRGDAVIHGLDGFSGAIGASRVDGCCSPVYHVCESIDRNHATYIARMLRILALDGYLGAHATSVRERAVDLRNWDLVGSIPVPLVAPEEQIKVASLIEKTVPIAEVTTRITSLLQERRQALITAVIAGEMDIPVVAA